MFLPARINEILDTLGDSYDFKLLSELYKIPVKYIDLNVDLSTKNSNYINYLGKCYIEGGYVKTNFNKAFELFLKAHNLNNISGTCSVGYCYLTGEGVAVDYKQGFTFANTAHNAGNVMATNNLAFCYEHGLGVDKDVNKAFNLLDESHKEYALATKNLGIMYLYGKGVNKDTKKAFELFLDSYLRGEKDSAVMLTYCYFNGVGVNKSIFTAIKYFDEYFPKAKYFVGLLLGIGINSLFKLF